jgi:hypothetical protein
VVRIERRIWGGDMGKVAKGVGKILGGPIVWGANYVRKQHKKAERAANEQANMQRNMIEQQQAQLRGEQARLEQNIAGAQAKINAGQARANRRRIRGGIFGDQLQRQEQQGLLNPRLG